MNQPDLLERVRQQFNSCPYPRDPLEASHKDDLNFLYFHSLVTAFYLCHREVIHPGEKVILDAGCGTGFKALGLAEANPDAKVVGIDISEKSVELAQQRLQYHGFNNAEFHVLAVEDLPQLGEQFDYINCDETLYLLDDPIAGLKAMKAVLKPDGILRVNLHSLHSRANMFRAQTAFKAMGLLDDNPGELAIELVRETMNSLKDEVMVKRTTWQSGNYAINHDEASILANYLLVGDRGFTIPELFNFLRAADLAFFQMVHWQNWDFFALFKEPDNLPISLGLILAEATTEEQLHLFELFHPVNRLLDVWCGYAPSPAPSVSEWTEEDWQNAVVHLHPLLKTPAFTEALMQSITQMQPFDLYPYLPISQSGSFVDSTVAACIFPPLLQNPQPLAALVQRWQTLHPVHPATLTPTSNSEAWQLLQPAILGLETRGYVLLEKKV